MESSTLAEVNWDFTDPAGGENDDWKWCMANATFTHREACEFILHIGPTAGDAPADPPYWRYYVAEMQKGGCSDAFVAAYLQAKDAGFARVLFWAA